jgi:uncharacterized protein (TIGR02266 family)
MWSPGGAAVAGRPRDRRRDERASVSVPIRISTIDAETDPWTGRPFFRASREVCGNVSRGGLFVHMPDPLSPGRRVLLEVELPGDDPFEAMGRVAWRRSACGERRDTDLGVGIEFQRTAPEQAARLERFLVSRMPR